MKSFLGAKQNKYIILRWYLIIPVFLSHHHKNVGVVLGSKLIFDEHLKMVSLKIRKTLGLLRKLHNLQARSALIAIYKAFV